MKLIDLKEMADAPVADEEQKTEFDIKIHVTQNSHHASKHQMWVATTDNYDGTPDADDQHIGYGSTPAEAIEDLRNWVHDAYVSEYTPEAIDAKFNEMIKRAKKAETTK